MIYTQNYSYTLYQGDMTKVLDELPENSVGSIVTDPPYEIGFMGKSWDSSGIAFQKLTWEKCLRVLKPGGYLLAFGGARTFHRIACAIEDAGFEIRDTVMWVFGSGFPKSMNVGLALDKRNNVESEIIGYESGTMPDFQDAGRKNSKNKIGFNDGESAIRKNHPIYKSQNEWGGWGTCLKPSYEPVIVARKPCEGSCVDNVIKYGVGGINIDECRVETEDKLQINSSGCRGIYGGNSLFKSKTHAESHTTDAQKLGRFPSNLILSYDDETYDEVCGGFPTTSSTESTYNYEKSNSGKVYGFSISGNIKSGVHFSDSGSASRYFYCAKASSKDRDEGLDYFEKKTSGELTERKDGSAGISAFAGSRCPKSNFHPTVKPVDLMQYLVRLVTPKGETVLDPFMGSGSTGKAVMFENRERDANYKFIGVELTEEYLPICEARIEYARDKYKYDIVEDENGNKTEMKKEELF